MSGWGGTLSSGGGGGGGGPGPVVSNFQPADGTGITPGTPLEFDVTGPNALVSLTITVVYRQTGATEVAYNREGFTNNFIPTAGFVGSERSTITDGFHFILRRRSGWPLSPSILVEGGDDAGNAVA